MEIRGLAPGDGTIRGVARNVDASRVRISGWARTDRYYAQPFLAAPFTPICSDGSWEYPTHPWEQVVVLLVADTYVLPAGPSIDYHPSTDAGVLAWAESPQSRRIRFADRTWWVKASEPFPTGPGPCVFSAGEENVDVDAEGFLHLRIARRDGVWTCAEIVHDGPLGFGTYTFQIGTVDRSDPNQVFAGFLFESVTREIDVEFSPSLACRPPATAQYVVQPYTRAGNLRCFEMTPTAASTHRIAWHPDRIEFWSWRGLDPFPPDPAELIAEWSYTGPDIPPATGRERMRFNAWLIGGTAPASGRAGEVVVRSFTFVPVPRGASERPSRRLAPWQRPAAHPRR